MEHMTKAQRRKALHAALLSIKARPYQYAGICYQLLKQLPNDTWRGIYADAKQLMREWPKYSGVSEFPVPHHKLDPEDAYAQAKADDNVWSRRTTYGRNRWELLDYLIERTKE